jgi:glycosidase
MNGHWFNDAVIYHIYSLSLARAEFHNDYSGQRHELSEIEAWIPHIKGLGCNAVLFSPVLKARSHGYDVTDYFQIDNRVGTNDEFAALVKKFHENGVRVVLDCVFNHCGRDFFAFAELRNGNRDYADWFSGVSFDRSSPLGDPFTYNTWSGHFELPKFNLHNGNVRNHLFEAARFWIDNFDIDGMRLDAANELDFGFMSELRRVTTDKKPDFWLMGEVVHGDYTRWVNPDTLHSVTNYILFKSLFSSHNDNNLFELSHCLQNTALSNGAPLYNFIDNHDQPRIASNIRNPGFLNTLYTLLFTLPGVPSIYYGSEWGIQGRKENNSDRPLRPYIDIRNQPNDVPWLLGYIRKLAAVRSGQSALKYGVYKHISCEYRKPFVFEREYYGERIFTAVNIADNAEPVNLARHHGGGFTDLLSDDKFTPQAAQNIQVPPYSSRVLKAV